MRRLVVLSLMLLVLAVDISVKWQVHAHVPLIYEVPPVYPYGGIGVFENFFGVQFVVTHATNTGTIWGLFPSATKLLVVMRLGIIGVIAFYLLRGRQRLIAMVPLGLILAGAIGNVVDFFVYGHVVDMFYFRLWGWDYPIFNLADAAIFTGVMWLLGRAFFGGERSRAAD